MTLGAERSGIVNGSGGNSRRLALLVVAVLAAMGTLFLWSQGALSGGPAAERTSTAFAEVAEVAQGASAVLDPPARAARGEDVNRRESGEGAPRGKAATRTEATVPDTNAKGTIFGTVRFYSRPADPLPKVRITRGSTTPFERTVVVAADGTYRMPDVPSGEWIVWCSASSAALQTIRIAHAGEEVRCDFTGALPRAVTVILTDPSGRALVSAPGSVEAGAISALQPRLVSSCPRRGEPIPAGVDVLRGKTTALTGANGEWCLVETSELPPAWVCVMRDGIVLDAAALPDVPGTVTLVVGRDELMRDTGTVEFRLVDSEGIIALSKVLVEIRSGASVPMWIHVGDDGAGVVTGVPAGAVTLRAKCAERVAVQRSGTLSAGGRLQLGTIEIAKTRSIAGHLVATGRAIDGRHVMSYVALVGDTMQPEPRIRGTVDVDAQLGFVITGLEPARYWISLDSTSPSFDALPDGHGGFQGWTVVDARNGDVTGVTMSVSTELLDTLDRERVLRPK